MQNTNNDLTNTKVHFPLFKKINMNKIFVLLIFSVVFVGCAPVGGSTRTKPKCDFNIKREVGLTNLNLKDPSGMSTLYKSLFPDFQNKTLRDVIETNGDGSFSNSAKIEVEVKANGRSCTGSESRSYNTSKNNDDINFRSLKIPFFNMTIRN